MFWAEEVEAFVKKMFDSKYQQLALDLHEILEE
jgi:hypothetical protein